MINNLGKTLALVFVGLSVMLMAMAIALYFNAVDFGWESPERYFHEAKGKKGDNLLVPSLFDKREAAMRQLVRVKRDELVRLGNLQDHQANVAMILGNHHLKGRAILDELDSGDGAIKVAKAKYNEAGGLALHPENPPELGFPMLDTPVPGVNMSQAAYLAKLKDVDARIEEKQTALGELLKKENEASERLGGRMDKDGKQTVDKAGNVLEPGWYYLLEKEYQTQQELLKEIEHVQPLWANELLDSQQVLALRDRLLRRLEQLGDKGYLSQSEFVRKSR
jgi:hypothetical protein